MIQSAGYQRRSYIRKFARLLDLIGPYLSFPQDISRNLGLSLLQKIRRDDTLVRRLRTHLKDYDNRSVVEEMTILQSFADGTAPDPDGLKPLNSRSARSTFQVGEVRCIAGQGGLTLKHTRDFTTKDRVKLTQGITRLLAAGTKLLLLWLLALVLDFIDQNCALAYIANKWRSYQW
ncbi:hypothetical protein [Yoonia sp.]|uniref:hypothetical protein n=1 Tax=Yoonia sp. TaxID=2212373 RepID=UPI0039197A70